MLRLTPGRIAAVLGGATLAAGAASAQTVTFTKIVGPDSEIRVLGNRPALRDGVVAFYGFIDDGQENPALVATAPADGAGPFTVLAMAGDEMPDEPGQHFLTFENPTIFDGLVAFKGDNNVLGSTYYNTIDAGPLQVITDFEIGNSFLGPNGITWHAEFGQNIMTLGGANDAFAEGGEPHPCGDGHFLFENVQIGHLPQASDGLIIWPDFAFDPDVDATIAVFTYDPLRGLLTCVASGHDDIPGPGVPFDYFFDADTDGQAAIFTAKDDKFVGFGAYLGLFMRSADGAGTITTIVDNETEAPGGGTFGSFGEITIDPGLVIFEACVGSPFDCDRIGIYAIPIEHDEPGEIIEIITTDDTIDDQPIFALSMDVAGRDANQLAIDVRHTPSVASLYVVNIDPASCPADFNADGELNILDFIAFQEAFTAGDPSTDCNADGALNILDFICFQVLFLGGCD
jgi:hypothetical protein